MKQEESTPLIGQRNLSSLPITELQDNWDWLEALFSLWGVKRYEPSPKENPFYEVMDKDQQIKTIQDLQKRWLEDRQFITRDGGIRNNGDAQIYENLDQIPTIRQSIELAYRDRVEISLQGLLKAYSKEHGGDSGGRPDLKDPVRSFLFLDLFRHVLDEPLSFFSRSGMDGGMLSNVPISQASPLVLASNQASSPMCERPILHYQGRLDWEQSFYEAAVGYDWIRFKADFLEAGGIFHWIETNEPKKLEDDILNRFSHVTTPEEQQALVEEAKKLYRWDLTTIKRVQRNRQGNQQWVVDDFLTALKVCLEARDNYSLFDLIKRAIRTSDGPHEVDDLWYSIIENYPDWLPQDEANSQVTSKETMLVTNLTTRTITGRPAAFLNKLLEHHGNPSPADEIFQALWPEGRTEQGNSPGSENVRRVKRDLLTIRPDLKPHIKNVPNFPASYIINGLSASQIDTLRRDSRP